MSNDQKIRNMFLSIIAILALVIVVFCCVFQYIHYHTPVKIDLGDYDTVENISFSIDSITKKNSAYDVINGWIALKGTPPVQFNTRLVLYKDNSNIAYSLPLKMNERKDVTDYFNDGENYDVSGFNGKIAHKYMEQDTYNIGLLVDIDRKIYLYKTGKAFQLTNEE